VTIEPELYPCTPSDQLATFLQCTPPDQLLNFFTLVAEVAVQHKSANFALATDPW